MAEGLRGREKPAVGLTCLAWNRDAMQMGIWVSRKGRWERVVDRYRRWQDEEDPDGWEAVWIEVADQVKPE
jgi:hypothetical protein